MAVNIFELHKKCSYHKDEVMAAGTCSCFYCLRTFDVSSIEEWIDGGETALCPFCGIDSVLPGDVGKDVLTEMTKYWFSY